MRSDDIFWLITTIPWGHNQRILLNVKMCAKLFFMYNILWKIIGKLNFYVTAVNKQLTGNGDNPAIGLLICKDNVVAEYSLEEVSQPIGIAGYELSNALSKEYQRSLPTIETLESEVAKMMDIK